MAEVPFNNPAPAAAPADEDEFAPPEEHALEVRPSGAIARPGEVSFTARLKPVYLSVVHGVGKLSEMGFPKGALVLDKEVEVYTPPRPAKPGEKPAAEDPALVTVLSVSEYWKEEVPFGTGVIPKTWPTEKDAQADGKITQYPKWGTTGKMPDARPAVAIRMLVREPDGVEDRGHFLINLNGIWWAPCTLIADKTAYGEVIDPLTRALYTHGASGIHTANWALSTRSKMAKTTGNFTYVPVFRVVGTKTPEDVTLLMAKLNGQG